MSDLILPHGGYRKMMSFQISQLVYDVTVRFCNKYIDKRSRTHDQMVQAARSGVQNIAEGSEDSGTSKKIELKLTQVARGSMEELKLDYEDYLRQRDYKIWERNDPRRQGIIDRRCQTAEEVSGWVKQACEKAYLEKGHDVVIQNFEEYSANAALVLVRVACSLLDTHVKRLADDFVKHGGFTERMYRVRSEKRKNENEKRRRGEDERMKS